VRVGPQLKRNRSCSGTAASGTAVGCKEQYARQLTVHVQSICNNGEKFYTIPKLTMLAFVFFVAAKVCTTME
jgi:hypothetical protein